MLTLTVRDHKNIQRNLVTTIVEIKERNPTADIEHICNAVEDEIREIRRLKQKYFDQFKDSPEVVAAALRTKINAIDVKTNSFLQARKAKA